MLEELAIEAVDGREGAKLVTEGARDGGRCCREVQCIYTVFSKHTRWANIMVR